MMSNKSRSIPAVVRKIFGKRPILASEDPTVYDQLLSEIISELEPQNLQQWLLVKDIADAEWELLRLKSMMADMVNVSIAFNLRFQSWNDTSKVAARIHLHVQDGQRGDAEAQTGLVELLGAHDTSIDAFAATAFEKTIVPQAHTVRMTTTTAKRRDAAYRELARLRSTQPREEPTGIGQGDVPHTDAEHATTAPNGSGASGEVVAVPATDD
jgi:hypothetical protein